MLENKSKYVRVSVCIIKAILNIPLFVCLLEIMVTLARSDLKVLSCKAVTIGFNWKQGMHVCSQNCVHVSHDFCNKLGRLFATFLANLNSHLEKELYTKQSSKTKKNPLELINYISYWCNIFPNFEWQLKGYSTYRKPANAFKWTCSLTSADVYHSSIWNCRPLRYH